MVHKLAWNEIGSETTTRARRDSLLAQQGYEKHREVTARTHEPLVWRTGNRKGLLVECKYSVKHLICSADMRFAFTRFGKLNVVFGGQVFM